MLSSLSQCIRPLFPGSKFLPTITFTRLMKVKVAKLCPTLCDPMDYSLPGSSVHGIFQVRILERVAFPFFRGSSQPGIKPRSPTLQVDSLPSVSPGKPHKAYGPHFSGVMIFQLISLSLRWCLYKILCLPSGPLDLEFPLMITKLLLNHHAESKASL